MGSLCKISNEKKCCLVKKYCRGRRCKSESGSCRFVGYIISKKVKRHCSWKKVSNHGKRLRCCIRTKRCHSKFGKCRVIGKKCHWSSKVIRNIPKKACFFKSYGNPSSRRKRCCRFNLYCIGKQCRPVEKKCKWVGFIYQKNLKSKCSWKKKTQHSIQRVCCKYFKVCRIYKKRKQCKNGKSICQWKGAEILTKFIKHCRYQPIGLYSRRKLCCRHKRVCKGLICSNSKKTMRIYRPKIFINTYYKMLLVQNFKNCKKKKML